jgi:hypothetical protein
MKLVYSLFLAFSFCFSQVLFSQIAPSIEWQKSLGGTGEDAASSIRQTSDGGFIIAGYSRSNDNDVSGNHGGADYWVVKTDATGTIQWQKSLGGTSNDFASDIQQTTDGGYIVNGYSTSIDGDVTGHHGTTKNDYWVVKLGAAGTIAWQKSLGGAQDDFGIAIQQTTDGGFVAAGYSKSTDGDVTGHHGGTVSADYWIVKLSSAGDTLWEKSLGGVSNDYANSIYQTSDGGFIVAGSTASNDGDVSGNHGSSDFWIVKLDSTGSIDWKKCLGGSSDDVASSVQQTPDDGYIVAGYTKSNDLDVSGNHGLDDYWVVKLDAVGDIDWQRAMGGSQYDDGYSIDQTMDNRFVVAGYSSSVNGDVSGYHGGAFWGDYWVAELSASGNIDWQKCIGGSNDDVANFIQETSTGGLIIAGWSESSDGDVTFNNGGVDVWIVQLAVPTTIDETGDSNFSFSLSPNPASSLLYIHLQLSSIENISTGSSSKSASITISNMLGKKIFQKTSDVINGTLEEEISLDEKFPDGMYLVNVNFDSGQIARPLFVVR